MNPTPQQIQAEAQRQKDVQAGRVEPTAAELAILRSRQGPTAQQVQEQARETIARMRGEKP